MPGTFVQSNHGTSFDVTNPSSSAWSGATTTGNHIIVGIVNDSGALNYVTSVTGAGVTTFTRRNSQIGTGGELCMWSGTVTSGATTALTFGFSQSAATRIVWLAQEWSGIDTTTPYDTQSTIASNAGSTSPLSSSSGILATSDEVVFGMVGWTTGTSTSSAGSGYSNLIANGGNRASPLEARFGALESKTVSATTAQTANFTLGTSRPWSAIVYAFRAAASTLASPEPFQGLPGNNVQQSFYW